MVERTNQKGLIEPVFSHDVRAAILVSQKKPGPYWCPEPILWELNSFLMQTLSFVPINLHRCWPREWKHSTEILKYIGAFLWDHLDQDQWSEITRISRSNEPMNPCPEWIHRFIWSTMIRVIWLDHLRGTHLQILIHSSTSLPLRPSFRSCVTVSSSRHNALFIISEKMASIRRILQTGQTGNLANASYQQPRRATLKHFVCSFGVIMAWRRILATGFYLLIFTQLLSSVAGQLSLQTVTNYLISDDRWNYNFLWSLACFCR